MNFAFIFILLHLAYSNGQVVEHHDFSSEIKEPHFRSFMKGSHQLMHVKFEKAFTSSGEPCKDYEILFTDLNGKQFTKHSNKNSIDMDYEELNNLKPQLQVNACGKVSFYDLRRVFFMIKEQLMESDELYGKTQQSRILPQKVDRQTEWSEPLTETQSQTYGFEQPNIEHGQSKPIVSPIEFQPEQNTEKFQQEKSSIETSDLHRPTVPRHDQRKDLEEKPYFEKEISKSIGDESSEWQKPEMTTSKEHLLVEQPSESFTPSFSKHKPLKIPGYQLPESKKIGLFKEMKSAEEPLLPEKTQKVQPKQHKEKQISGGTQPTGQEKQFDEVLENVPRPKFEHKNIGQEKQSNVPSYKESKNGRREMSERPELEREKIQTQNIPEQKINKEKPLSIPSFEKNDETERKNVKGSKMEKRDVEQQTQYQTNPKQTLKPENLSNIQSFKKSQTGMQEVPESQMNLLTSEFGRRQFEEKIAYERPSINQKTLWEVPKYDQIETRTKQKIEEQRSREKMPKQTFQKQFNIPSFDVKQKTKEKPIQREVEQAFVENPSELNFEDKDVISQIPSKEYLETPAIESQKLEQAFLKKPIEKSKFEESDVKESGSQMFSKKSWEKPSVEGSKFEQPTPKPNHVEQRPASFEKKSDVEYEEKRQISPIVEQTKAQIRPSREERIQPLHETLQSESLLKESKPSLSRQTDLQLGTGTMVTTTKTSWKSGEYQPKLTAKRSSSEIPSITSNSFGSEKIQKELQHLETPVLAQVVAQQPSEILPKREKAIYEEIVVERRRVPMTSSPLTVSAGASIFEKQPIEQQVKQISSIQLEKPVQQVSTAQPVKLVQEKKVNEIIQPRWVESRTVSSAASQFSSNFLGVIIFSTLFAIIVNKLF
jgi:hypothetical protein